MVIDSSNINNTKIHLSSYRNSLKTKRTITYDVGNTDPCLERGKTCGGLALTPRVPLVQQKRIHCILLLWVSPCSFCSVTCVHNLSSVFYPYVLLDTTLWAKVCQWLPVCRWFSPVSSNNKTDRYDIAEILLKMVLITITLTDMCYFCKYIIVVNRSVISLIWR